MEECWSTNTPTVKVEVCLKMVLKKSKDLVQSVE